ncbi:hypothetical protein DFH11DRAFT_1579997, partial [Phellopilus nigrolimitatus]
PRPQSASLERAHHVRLQPRNQQCAQRSPARFSHAQECLRACELYFLYLITQRVLESGCHALHGCRSDRQSYGGGDAASYTAFAKRTDSSTGVHSAAYAVSYTRYAWDRTLRVLLHADRHSALTGPRIRRPDSDDLNQRSVVPPGSPQCDRADAPASVFCASADDSNAVPHAHYGAAQQYTCPARAHTSAHSGRRSRRREARPRTVRTEIYRYWCHRDTDARNDRGAAPGRCYDRGYCGGSILNAC